MKLRAFRTVLTQIAFRFRVSLAYALVKGSLKEDVTEGSNPVVPVVPIVQYGTVGIA